MLRGNAAEPEVKEEMASSSVRGMSLFLFLISVVSHRVTSPKQFKDALRNTVQPDSAINTVQTT